MRSAVGWPSHPRGERPGGCPPRKRSSDSTWPVTARGKRSAAGVTSPRSWQLRHPPAESPSPPATLSARARSPPSETRLPAPRPAGAGPAGTTGISANATERSITLERSHAPALGTAAGRSVDKGQDAHGEETRRAEGEERDGPVALVGVEEPGAPGAIEPERDLDETLRGAAVHVGLAAPVSSCRTDAELRRAHELEILSPQRVEHGQARAPRHPDTDDHDGGDAPCAAQPAWIEHPLGVDEQESWPEDAQPEGQAHVQDGVSLRCDLLGADQGDRKKDDGQHGWRNREVRQVDEGLVPCS